MPNWCSNTLEISGTADEVKRFKRLAEGPTDTYNEFRSAEKGSWGEYDDIRVRAIASVLPQEGDSILLSFHRLYPVPEEIRRYPYDDNQAIKLSKALGEPNSYGGYGWQSNHWGCKWGACDIELSVDEECFLQYDFNTPWGPPMGLLLKVSKDFPNLELSIDYRESGMGFAGKAAWSNGECEFQDTWDLEDDEVLDDEE